MRTMEKASGRRAGSAASGIRACKGEGGSSPLSLPDPARRPPLFQSSTLTESLEQASAGREKTLASAGHVPT